jgi:alkanesulfonate monooxygenase SsuD/methylene tetrahydromethanopterin reductase-like flavin-dependent oxidoreductase (luciferase family)
MVAIIGGEPHRFRPLIDLYREAGRRSGHAPEKLKVGIHCLGYVAQTTEQAADDFFPGYARAFTEIGKERGWPPVTRLQFDALRRETGALFLGDPATVAAKILSVSEALGGLSRFTLQMSVAALSHEKAKQSIGLLGREVIPLVKKALQV